MKTNLNFSYYLAQFFLELEMLHSKVVEKIKTHILYSINSLPQVMPLMR